MFSEIDNGMALYLGFCYGLGWGMAYYVDQPEWKLAIKLGVSLLGMLILVGIGYISFDLPTAISSIMKFSTVFVAYYLIASFRSSKSLRN